MVCCSPWGRKESDTAEQLNNNSIANYFAAKQKLTHIAKQRLTHNAKQLYSNKIFLKEFGHLKTGSPRAFRREYSSTDIFVLVH